MSVLAAISAAISLFDGTAPVIDAILNLANSTLGAVVYVQFIKFAQAVRRDALNGAK
jgi:glycopeptide antibiotics resistance protein